MRAIPFVLSAVTLVVAILAAQPAAAQATRTWVSGVGDDANPCSRTAPCKTFAGAISKTAAGGEINALDPGGFGAVTITKSITIDGGGGQIASVLVAGTNGIVINGSGITVTLRNISIDGLRGTPTPGLNGIQFLAGAALHVEHCAVFGFSQNAINVNLNQATAAQVFVTDTIASNSAGGVVARNAAAGKVSVAVQRSTLSQNSNAGFKADGSGAGTILGMVSDSLMAGNGTGAQAAGTPAAVGIQVARSTVVNNTTGLNSTGAAFLIVSNTLISGNTTGVAFTAPALLQTYKNNAVDGNTANGTFSGNIVPE
jgi:hypothetical protein